MYIGDCMNIFQIVLMDVILVLFPILVYLIYLSNSHNISNKKIYENLALFSSFFLILKYGIKDPLILSILVLNSVVFLSYIQDKYILANLFLCLIIFNYIFKFRYTYILFLICVLGIILYILKRFKKINNIV